jgi:hypothetical protein
MKDWLVGGVIFAIGLMVVTAFTFIFLKEQIYRLAEMFTK